MKCDPIRKRSFCRCPRPKGPLMLSALYKQYAILLCIMLAAAAHLLAGTKISCVQAACPTELPINRDVVSSDNQLAAPPPTKPSQPSPTRVPPTETPVPPTETSMPCTDTPPPAVETPATPTALVRPTDTVIPPTPTPFPPTRTVTATPTPTETIEPAATASATVEPSPTPTDTPTAVPSPTSTPTPSFTATPSETPLPPTATATSTPPFVQMKEGLTVQQTFLFVGIILVLVLSTTAWSLRRK